MRACRVVFLQVEALRALQWVRDSYQGDIALVHIGFPTPFVTRSSDNYSVSGSPRTVHDKPEFMVQVRLPAHAPQHSCIGLLIPPGY